VRKDIARHIDELVEDCDSEEEMNKGSLSDEELRYMCLAFCLEL
jgi:hypothetical protein